MRLNTASLFQALALRRQTVSHAVVGLDFNHSHLFALELQKTGNRYTLVRFVQEPVPVQVKEAAQTAAIKSAPPWDLNNPSGQVLLSLLERANFGGSPIHIALSGPSVLTRFIQFPTMTLKDLKAAMQYEIEKYIPFEGTDVISDFHILSGESADKKTMKLILVAAKKTEVFSLLEFFHKMNLKIRVIDIHAFACLNAFSYSHPEAQKGTTVMLDIGLETTSLLVLTENEPAFIREISMGSADLTDTLRKKIGGDDSSEKPFLLEDGIAGHPDLFAEAVEPLASQIRLSLNYFVHNHPKAESPRLLYLSGELCHLAEFQSHLNRALDLEPTLWDCLQGIDLAPEVPRDSVERFRHMLPLTVGLALRME